MNMLANESEAPQFPDGVDKKYAGLSVLGDVLSDTPEQVERDAAQVARLNEVSKNAAIGHTARMTEAINSLKSHKSTSDELPTDVNESSEV